MVQVFAIPSKMARVWAQTLLRKLSDVVMSILDTFPDLFDREPGDVDEVRPPQVGASVLLSRRDEAFNLNPPNPPSVICKIADLECTY